MTEDIDCAVIGAGVVGLAVARALALAGERSPAQAALDDADAVVEGRLEQIHDPALRRTYLESHLVRAIRSGLPA